MSNLENRMVIEERFEYEGLGCLVVFYPHGYRCGYVGVKEDSLLDGLHYDDVDCGITCHGGLTFSGRDNDKFGDDLYYYGWDYAHAGDQIDVDSLKRYYPFMSICGQPFPFEHLYTCAEVKEEVKNVAKQLIELEENIKDSVCPSALDYLLHYDEFYNELEEEE